MMKQVIICLLVLCALSACDKPTIGYLITENASYKPDTTYVRKTPDPVKDSMHIKQNSPWVTSNLQGYEGTEQIFFSVESVTSPDQGEAAAANFKKNLTIRGAGAMSYPFKNDAVPGTYVVSIRLTNDGYSHVLKDVMTFIVTE